MSNLECPYCLIKAEEDTQALYRAHHSGNGTCPDCGAELDVGQTKVLVNRYGDIYRGAVHLLGEMVDRFNYILAALGADLTEIDGEEEITIAFTADHMVDELFLNGVGQTTRMNFLKAIGVKRNPEFTVKPEEYEP